MNVRGRGDLGKVISKKEYQISSDHSKVLWFRPIDHMTSILTTSLDIENYADGFNPRIAAS